MKALPDPEVWTTADPYTIEVLFPINARDKEPALAPLTQNEVVYVSSRGTNKRRFSVFRVR